jgi:hypothetical protein
VQNKENPKIFTETPLEIYSSTSIQSRIMDFPNSLLSIKEEILNCLNITHGIVFDINNRIASSHDSLYKENRYLSVELLNALFNGLSILIQEILFKFYNDRNATINDILELGRNTWNSLENLSILITGKFSPIAPPFPINEEQDQLKLAKLMDRLIVDALTIMENEPQSFQDEINTILILAKQTLCQRTSHVIIDTPTENKLLQFQRLF